MPSKVTNRARALRTQATDSEKRLWSKLQKKQMGVKFRRQHPIPPYIVDFCCVEKRLVVEVDGSHHADNLGDDKRTAFLEGKGYTVLRFWNTEVLENIEGVVVKIDEKLHALPPYIPPPTHGRGDEGGRERVEALRADFPVLSKTMNGKPLVYLDTAASAQKPHAVIDAMASVMENHYSNIHRGLYSFSQVNTEACESVRGKIARFINAPSEKEIVFTRNTTEGINLVAQSYARTHLSTGDEIILSAMEHHANIVPWQLLAQQIGVNIKFIALKSDGTIDVDHFLTLLTSKTRIVSIVHTSNALGTINPVKEIIQKTHHYDKKIKVLVDGSQAVVHGSVDIQALGCDFFTFTGHKLYGPTGIGVLWGRYDLLESMSPYQGGGDMINTVAETGSTYKSPPARFEAGTPAIVEIIGLGAAIDYVQAIGMDTIAAHERALLDYAMEQMRALPGLTFYGTAPEKAGIISFTADWAHPSDIAMILDQCGVAIRTGHHCCMPLMKRLGVERTARASFGLYTNKNDIDIFLHSLQKAKDMLG